MAHIASAFCPAIPAERRHHHRIADAECALCSVGQGRRMRAAARCSAGSRSISSKPWRPATLFFSPAGRFASRASARTNVSSPMRAGVDAKVPIYAGGKFPLSTYLAEQVRGMLADPDRWKALPEQVSDWLRLQKEKSVLPRKEDLLVETFPRANRFYMVVYAFEGRLAHQTLGMLLNPPAGTRRCPSDRLCRDRLFARRLGAGGHGRDVQEAAGRRLARCSTKTCSATTSMPGWRRAGC